MRRWVAYFRLRKCGLFDARYYLRKYPDVRRADIDPLSHFIKYGWKEGRNPGPSFDTRFYLETYPDVRQANINPLIHYIQHGQHEGRLPAPVSDPSQPRNLSGSELNKWDPSAGKLAASPKDGWMDQEVLEEIIRMLG